MTRILKQQIPLIKQRFSAFGLFLFTLFLVPSSIWCFCTFYREKNTFFIESKGGTLPPFQKGLIPPLKTSISCFQNIHFRPFLPIIPLPPDPPPQKGGLRPPFTFASLTIPPRNGDFASKITHCSSIYDGRRGHNEWKSESPLYRPSEARS